MQVDLPNGRSGLVDFLDRFDRRDPDDETEVKVVHLGTDDCQRHSVVKEVLRLY